MSNKMNTDSQFSPQPPFYIIFLVFSKCKHTFILLAFFFKLTKIEGLFSGMPSILNFFV